jgi:hypothetical protein
MSVLLDEVKEVSKGKLMMWVNLGGVWKKRRLHIVLSILLGDQKSQDFLCSRKAILTTDQPAGFTTDAWPRL